MPAAVKKPLNHFLREVCIPALTARVKYFSIEQVRRFLAERKVPASAVSLKTYMNRMTRSQFIHDAGRGWYSSLATPFTLDTAPVQPLADALAKAFPLVTFSCWSTEQVKGAMHHLLSRFVTFVNVEADAMESVCEHLRDAGWDAWLNPRGAEAARFAVRERTVVVRRESRKSPSSEPLASIEKLLVELCFEARDLRLMALPEFHRMLANLAGTHRIRMATLLDYAAARELSPESLLGDRNQLIPPFSQRRL